MEVPLPKKIKGRRGRPSTKIVRRRYKPYRYDSAGRPKRLCGHTYLGHDTVWINRDKRNATQARTIIHETLHATDPWWWRFHNNTEYCPEAMIRRLESVVWDIVRAFLVAQSENKPSHTTSPQTDQ